MSTFAKSIRWSRFLDKRSQKGLVVPIDHGLTAGPLKGLERVDQIASFITHASITGIIAHKGMIERLGRCGYLGASGLMVHLNGMTSISAYPNQKERLTSIEAAVRLGADAVSLQLNFDGSNDAQNLVQLGAAVDEAGRYGLPVLTMLYDKAPCEGPTSRTPRLRHLMRTCVELGTDAIKLSAPDPLSDLPALLAGVKEHTAILIAGGAVCSEADLLRLARTAIAAGATGLCVGRNVFQRQDVTLTLSRLGEALLRPADERAL